MKIMEKQSKNNSLGGQSCKKSILLMIMFIMFLMGIVSSLPTSSIISPTGTIDYGQYFSNYNINYTTNGANDSCWINYNFVNTTYPCTIAGNYLYDNFNDNNLNTTLWGTATTGSATVSETGSQLFVYGFTGDAYAWTKLMPPLNHLGTIYFEISESQGDIEDIMDLYLGNILVVEGTTGGSLTYNWSFNRTGNSWDVYRNSGGSPTLVSTFTNPSNSSLKFYAKEITGGNQALIRVQSVSYTYLLSINLTTQKNMTLYANDTIGNLNYSYTTWDYILFSNSETYNPTTTSGNVENFGINITYDSSYYPNVVGRLNYNGTNYIATQTGNSFARTINIPIVTSQQNISFYWTFDLIHNSTSTDYVNSTSHPQTINTLGIDNCSVYTNVLFNFTLKDEDTQTKINATQQNSSIKTTFTFYNLDRTLSLLTYSTFFNKTNPASICFNGAFPLTSQYSVDGVVEYTASGYANELYNIQNYTLTNSTTNQSIFLYDLVSTNAQPFRITYKDSSYLPVGDALVIIQRRYTDEGIFKTVEIPKTDSYGETIGYFVLNDVVYTITITRMGQILGIFNNVRVVCQTPSIYECRLDLNSFGSSIPVTNFTVENDFYFTITHNKTTRTTTANFVVLSGTSAHIVLNVSKEDALGTRICTETIDSNAGTLTCISPANIGNGTIIAQIYKDGVLMGQGQLSLENTPSTLYGGMAVFLAIFIMMTLVGVGISDSPVYTTLFLMVGVILLFALNLVAHNGFIGSGATILFIIIAIVLVIIKGGKRQ